jgi:hypothetical protein
VRGGGIVPLERAIVRATKAVGKSERTVKNTLRDFANVGRREEASFHAQGKQSLGNFDKYVANRKLYRTR